MSDISQSEVAKLREKEKKEPSLDQRSKTVKKPNKIINGLTPTKDTTGMNPVGYAACHCAK